MNMYSLRTEKKVAAHYGIFRYQIGMWEAVALIVSGTIGAGVLALPYVITKVGILLGLGLTVGLGLLMMVLNLFAGEIAVRTKQRLQLAGLAGKYLGPWAKAVMTILTYIMLFGALLIYIIGEGEALGALFNGDPFTWSLLFFSFVALLVLFGLRTIKTVELVLTAAILLIVLAIALWSAPHVSLAHLATVNIQSFFLPYGVILFAFHGVSAVPEAHALLADKQAQFKKAVVYAGIINIIVYCVFVLSVVGVTGNATTEIATIGLGDVLGPVMLLFGNIFAALAMGTSYLLVAVSMTHSLHWDFKVPRSFAVIATLIIPFLFFLFGFRQFISTIDVMGGVFITTELLIILGIYLRAKKAGDLPLGRYRLHYVSFLFVTVLLALLIGAVYSVITLFI